MLRLFGFLFIMCLFFILGWFSRGWLAEFQSYRQSNKGVLSEQAKGWFDEKTKDIK
jgi:hypothetical protein